MAWPAGLVPTGSQGCSSGLPFARYSTSRNPVRFLILADFAGPQVPDIMNLIRSLADWTPVGVLSRFAWNPAAYRASLSALNLHLNYPVLLSPLDRSH